jgi:rubrerythrin
MRLSPEEMEAAKRAARRLHCPGDIAGKHTLQKAVAEGKHLVWRCVKCGFEPEQKNP